jgi:MOSC domain-containing protein YiiM
MQQTLWSLMEQFPLQGELMWIGLRPDRKQAMQSITECWLNVDQGIIGDHYKGRSKKRQVTLLQWEHLAVLESLLSKPVLPEQLRRNLVIRGVNLTALKKHRFQLSSAELEMTGLCHPCSRMENELGQGGYNAMRNHGGITAQVIKAGRIRVGDNLTVLDL